MCVEERPFPTGKGCVSGGECFWNAGKCDTDPATENCGEVGITGGDTSAKVYRAIGTECNFLLPSPAARTSMPRRASRPDLRRSEN